MITQQNKIIELKLMEAIMEVKTWEELKDNATELNKKIDDMNFEEFSKSVILPSFLYTIYDFMEKLQSFQKMLKRTMMNTQAIHIKIFVIII